jgi:serine protease Do
VISARLTATRGAVASTPTEIWANAELLLITARVRGGFSGGPVLDEAGRYIGVVAREAAHHASDKLDEALHRYDDLGYGTAIPSGLVSAFIDGAERGTGLSVPVDLSGTELSDFDE